MTQVASLPPVVSADQQPISSVDNKSCVSASTLNSYQSVSEEIDEREKRLGEEDPYFINLLRKDREFKLSPDFLHQKKINIKMRARLIKWLQQLIQEYEFKLDTYFLAVMILDKYLEKSEESSKELQMIGACCLYIASKISETKLVSPDFYVYSSGDSFDVSGMLGKQKQILGILEFNTTFSHASKFIKALGNLNNIEYQECQRVLVMLEQSVESYKYSRLQLSKMVIVIVRCGCCVTSNEELASEVRRIENLLDI